MEVNYNWNHIKSYLQVQTIIGIIWILILADTTLLLLLVISSNVSTRIEEWQKM